MAKTKTKAEAMLEKPSDAVRREFIIGHGYRVVVESNGVIHFLGKDDELLISVEKGGKILRASRKVREVVQDAAEEKEDKEELVSPAGEEWEDEIFREHKVYEKLVARMKKTEPLENWRARLDEL
jgi:hypothetical protein